MTVRAAIGAGALPVGGALEAVPVAQVTSEGLALTVAALIALAVLAVLGGVVMVVRRDAGTGAQPWDRRVEADTGEAGEPLWAAGGPNGAAGGQHDARTEPDDAMSAPGARGVTGARGGTGTGPADATDADTGLRRTDHDIDLHGPEPAEPAPAAIVVRPPVPAEAWTAEIVWAADATRFRVVARRADDADVEPVAIAQTEPLSWPPRDDASVQAMTDASATLETVLLDSGWSSLPAGEAWYSKRFGWEPQDATRDPRSGSGRFDRRPAEVADLATPHAVAADAPPGRQ